MNKIANEMYRPLSDRAGALTASLSSNGFETSWGWFNYHLVRVNDGTELEYYPIPVIAVAGYGDLAVDFDAARFEFTLPRKKALSYHFERLAAKYRTEVYGCDHCENNFYADGMDVRDTAFNISSSKEAFIHVSIAVSPDIDAVGFRQTLADIREAEVNE